ncbi:hypothetical protein ETD86_30005 [Nonomuraea turkmeniaca]|uniref:Uncharacterized protein n=1 Tax=Nonomuraea turkmeniaca TaxID=103838 RepID=A0A5S4F9S9_9ACTN|nr:hypothetical protein [Nonomuraea turkmeniaca]TMR13802.1 hypothetical protein ETD86_30005 [Nonomuraea turkmeniaca]
MKFALPRRQHRGAHTAAAPAAAFGSPSSSDADHEQWIAFLSEPDPEPAPEPARLQPLWGPVPYVSTAEAAR